MQTILETRSLANTSLQELTREMLVRLGEDPERDGLLHTPERMERSLHNLTKGNQENPEEVLLGAGNAFGSQGSQRLSLGLNSFPRNAFAGGFLRGRSVGSGF